MSARSRAERLAKRRAERYERNREIAKHWYDITGHEYALELLEAPWDKRLAREHKKAARLLAEAEQEREYRSQVFIRERRNLTWSE